MSTERADLKPEDAPDRHAVTAPAEREDRPSSIPDLRRPDERLDEGAETPADSRIDRPDLEAPHRGGRFVRAGERAEAAPDSRESRERDPNTEGAGRPDHDQTARGSLDPHADERRVEGREKDSELRDAHVVDVPIPKEEIDRRSGPDGMRLADDVPSRHVPPDGDRYDVVLHGDETRLQADIDGRRIDMTPAQLAEAIRQRPDWGERDIRLMSCSAGTDAVAGALHEDLGAQVKAPSDKLWIWASGKIVIGPDQSTDSGHWLNFPPEDES